VDQGLAAQRTDRHEAICDAVFELLSEVGYDRMSMDAVAARARASKATIYRAWPNKPDLVMEAVVHRFGQVPDPADTGSLRGDLLALTATACQFANGPDGAAVTGLLTAATRNPELSRTLYDCTYKTKHQRHVAIIARAVARGEVASGTDPELLHEVLFALVLSRKMWASGPLDEAFVTHVVDDVLLPVLHHTA
jgi:AcrR family transcriptional regulator